MKNRFDRVFDKMMFRTDSIVGKLDKDFKKTNPFQMEPVTDEDVIREYMSYPEEAKLQLRNDPSFVMWENQALEALSRRKL